MHSRASRPTKHLAKNSAEMRPPSNAGPPGYCRCPGICFPNENPACPLWSAAWTVLYALLLILMLEPWSFAMAQTATATPTPTPIRINCGGPAYNDSFSNRAWAEDSLQGVGIAATTEQPSNAQQDTRIYQSARIFTSASNYSSNCVKGTMYFVRLLFNAFPYTSYSLLNASFSVRAGNVVLMTNWSPSPEANGQMNAALMKEFGVMCPTSVMILEFTPSPNSFAFVNAFELFPMADSLYSNISLGRYAFETLYRWNCGGGNVFPSDDFYWRKWSLDAPGLGTTVDMTDQSVRDSNVAPTYTPLKVFQVARVAMSPLIYTLNVERGATYFVRLLFAEMQFGSMGQRVMNIEINSQRVETSYDIYTLVGLYVGTWKDFIVSQPQYLPNLTIALEANAASIRQEMLINGLEIFKIGQSNLSATEFFELTTSPKSGQTGLLPISQGSASNILLDFTSTSPGNGAILSNWNNNSNVCDWFGITCSDGIVIGLNLSVFSGGIGGVIPDRLGQLSSLQTVVLSKQQLVGTIPASLGGLTELKMLRLDNNGLSGEIPRELGALQGLMELTVQNNNLTGEVPFELLNSRALQSFLWRGGNVNLCAPVGAANNFSLITCGEGYAEKKSSESSSSNIKVLPAVLGSVAAVAFLAVSILMLRCFCRIFDVEGGNSLLESYTGSYYTTKMSKSGMSGGGGGGVEGASPTSMMMDSRKLGQRFSIEEMAKATCQFDDGRIIGMGGFGNVYKGVLDDGEVVAVKRGSAESRQGMREFETEIFTLSKLRHRHLVNLVGYCDDDNEMILVYEYMAKGTLRGHLYGKGMDSGAAPLSWRKRLEICIGSARGLEYLHSGAQDMVIHRDVKSTNILLDDNLVAKMADFGLSKSGPNGIGETHVSTAVKGSFGYIDPAYFKTQQLTEKSDVFSFGVVLLESITARAPVAQGGDLPKGQQISLADWAIPYLQAGKVEQIVDPKLVNSYGTASLYKVAEVALRCLDDDRDCRPSMADVLRGLEDALMLQDNSLSVVLDTPAAMMSAAHYESESGYQGYTNDSSASYPPSPPESLLIAR